MTLSSHSFFSKGLDNKSGLNCEHLNTFLEDIQLVKTHFPEFFSLPADHHQESESETPLIPFEEVNQDDNYLNNTEVEGSVFFDVSTESWKSLVNKLIISDQNHFSWGYHFSTMKPKSFLALSRQSVITNHVNKTIFCWFATPWTG